jgi:cytochrome c-type biogenesis protein CcmH
MLLAVALMVMTAAVVASVVVPLMRAARPLPERSAFDRAVYRDQLDELERDVARGLIDAREASTARLEIERRLLAADAGGEGAAQQGAMSPKLAVGLAMGMPMAAALIYLALGAPGVPDQPFAARAPAATPGDGLAGHADFAAGAAKLEQELAANPADAEKWLLLARTEAELRQWQKSADAYRRAMSLTGGGADLASAYGEMLVMAAEGIVTPAAHQAFETALAHDPADVAARFYLALGEAQAGNTKGAIESWQKLAAEQPNDSEIRAELRRRIEEAARIAGIPAPPLPPPSSAAAAPPPAAGSPAGAPPGPSAQDIANAQQMSDADRQAMIRSMVERLAARLDSQPNDLEGWLRLGRAYDVLGERDKAAAAYERARRLKPDDPRIAAAMAGAAAPPPAAANPAVAPPGPSAQDIAKAQQMPDADRQAMIRSMVERLATRLQSQPNDLEGWLRLGRAYGVLGERDKALDAYERAQNLLPAGSDQRQAVAAAIAGLKAK